MILLSTVGSAFSTWSSSSWSVMSLKNGITATSPGPDASSEARGLSTTTPEFRRLGKVACFSRIVCSQMSGIQRSLMVVGMEDVMSVVKRWSAVVGVRQGS